MPLRGSLVMFIYLFASDVGRYMGRVCHNITLLLDFSYNLCAFVIVLLGKLSVCVWVVRFPSLTSTCTHLCAPAPCLFAPLVTETQMFIESWHAHMRSVSERSCTPAYTSTYILPEATGCALIMHPRCWHFLSFSLALSVTWYRVCGCARLPYSDSTWAQRYLWANGLSCDSLVAAINPNLLSYIVEIHVHCIAYYIFIGIWNC